MIDIRALFATAVFTLLAGCGSSTNTPNPASPPIAAKPDVIVTIDGKRHACVVALLSEAQGSSVPCGDVIPFVRDELRLPSGSSTTFVQFRTLIKPRLPESTPS